jgi:hypothetical protein
MRIVMVAGLLFLCVAPVAAQERAAMPEKSAAFSAVDSVEEEAAGHARARSFVDRDGDGIDDRILVNAAAASVCGDAQAAPRRRSRLSRAGTNAVPATLVDDPSGAGASSTDCGCSLPSPQGAPL